MTAKKPKPVPVRFNQFTKAELIRTIKTLEKRQTQLLNKIAKLEQLTAELDAGYRQHRDEFRAAIDKLHFPWENK